MYIVLLFLDKAWMQTVCFLIGEAGPDDKLGYGPRNQESDPPEGSD